MHLVELVLGALKNGSNMLNHEHMKQCMSITNAVNALVFVQFIFDRM